MKKADNGNRTRLSGLGSRRSTDEPYLQKEHKILYSMFLYFASPNFYIFTILLICLFILLIQDSQPLQSVPNAVFIHVRGDIICRFQHLFTGITHSNAGVGIL